MGAYNLFIPISSFEMIDLFVYFVSFFRHGKLEKVMESHGLWRTQKSTNPVIWTNIWGTLVSSFFLAPYRKGSATALPEGAFVVYLNLKKNYT